MKFSPKASIIISLVSAIAWAGLFALFYFSPNDLGQFAEIDFGQVRGAATVRFELPEDEILIASKTMPDSFDQDRVLLTKTNNSEIAIVRVISGSVMVFEQRVPSEYTKIEYQADKGFFEISSPISGNIFDLAQINGQYALTSLE